MPAEFAPLACRLLLLDGTPSESLRPRPETAALPCAHRRRSIPRETPSGNISPSQPSFDEKGAATAASEGSDDGQRGSLEFGGSRGLQDRSGGENFHIFSLVFLFTCIFYSIKIRNKVMHLIMIFYNLICRLLCIVYLVYSFDFGSVLHGRSILILCRV